MYKNIKIRIAIIILLSIIIGVLSFKYLNQTTEKQMIIIAAKDIEAMHIINQDDVKVVELEKNSEVTYSNMYESIDDVIGNVTKEQIKAGTQILSGGYMFTEESEEKLVKTDDNLVDQAFFIPEDKRIVSISSDSTGALNNSVKAGDYIDIIYTSTDISTGGLYSRMILQHIEVFDVQSIEATTSGVSQQQQNIQLLASPDESVILVAANRNGVIDCVLNPLQGEIEYANPINVLSFNVPPPRSIREELEYIKNYINSVDMTSGTKDKLLGTIDEEFSMKNVELLIRESNMDYDVKLRLLEFFQ